MYRHVRPRLGFRGGGGLPPGATSLSAGGGESARVPVVAQQSSIRPLTRAPYASMPLLAKQPHSGLPQPVEDDEFVEYAQIVIGVAPAVS